MLLLWLLFCFFDDVAVLVVIAVAVGCWRLRLFCKNNAAD